jgi:hypothetical protein
LGKDFAPATIRVLDDDAGEWARAPSRSLWNPDAVAARAGPE